MAGMISGMIVWAVWFVIVYSLTGIGCDAGWHRRAVPGGNLLTLVMLASTLLALSIITWCAWRGFLRWRDTAEAGDGIDNRQRRRFTGLVMGVLSLIAAASTMMVAIPMLMLDPCAA